MPVWIGVISSIEEIKYIEDIKNLDVKLSTVARTRIYSQGFETGETDLTANNCTQEVQSTEVYGGNYALKVTVPAGQTGYVETPKRPVSPNQLLTFGFVHKEDANIDEVKLMVVWYRANGGIISTDEFTLTPSTSWSIESRTVSAPQNADTVALRIQATAGGGNGTIYIDEITIDIIGQILSVDGAGRVKINIDEDSVGLAKDQTLQAVRDRLPSALTANGNFKVAIQEDNADLLKEGGNVNVANFPSDYPDSGTHERLDNLKPDRSTPTKELDGVSVGAGAVENIDKSGLSGWSALVVTVRATYDSNATAGVRVRWLYSPDGINYDRPDDAEDQGNYEDLYFSPGVTSQRTILIPILTPYVRVQIVNLDTGYPVTVHAWSTLLR